MGSSNNVQKLGNLQRVAYNPIPQIEVPAMPDKLRRIDPTGHDQWVRAFNQSLQDWVKKMNVAQQAQSNTLLNLVKKP
jgi:hypothetical protein